MTTFRRVKVPKDARGNDPNDFREDPDYVGQLEEANESAAPPFIGTCRMADVQPEAVSWLWPGRIALGKVTLVAGDPGLGKSLLTVAIAAHVSRGTPWPVDRAECPQGEAIMVSAEDDPADTVRPRLDAAGADVCKVHMVTIVHDMDGDGRPVERCFSLSKDIRNLDDLLSQRPDCCLVTIDPVSAYLGGTDSHNNADIRALLAPLAAVASKHKIAIVCVTHLNKSQQASAIYRANGSLAFVAAARAAYSVTKDPGDADRRLILPLKNNLGDDRTGFAYRIIQAETGAPVLAWEDDPVEMDLEDLANAVTERKPRPVERAKAWLQSVLHDGPVLVTKLKEMAEEAGHSWGTVRRAQHVLDAKPIKQRFDGQWEWQLPKDTEDLRFLKQASIQDAHQGTQLPPDTNVSILGKSEHLGGSKMRSSYEGAQFNDRGEMSIFDWLAPISGTSKPKAIEPGN